MTSLKIVDLQRDAREEGISIGMERGIERGREEGISVGAYEKAVETARNLLQDGFTPEAISRYTLLPLETVKGMIHSDA